MAYVHLQVLVKKKDDSINTSAIINKLGVSNEAPLFMQVSPHWLSRQPMHYDYMPMQYTENVLALIEKFVGKKV